MSDRCNDCAADKKIRDKTVVVLQSFLAKQVDDRTVLVGGEGHSDPHLSLWQSSISELELMKLWKGLFYCERARPRSITATLVRSADTSDMLF